MLKIAICDDEKTVISQIEKYVETTCRAQKIAVETNAFEGGDALLEQVQAGIRYDLIYFDIRMKQGDGIATAEKIRKIDEEALFIYISGYEQYMMELFRLNVYAFIKKPIDELEFVQKLSGAYQKICEKQVYYIFNYRNQEYKLLCKEILYFESNGHKIDIHLRNGETVVYKAKLSDIENKLASGKIRFLRIHQSYLVNYNLIRSRNKNEVFMVDGTRLPISADRKKNIDIEYSRLLQEEISIM